MGELSEVFEGLRDPRRINGQQHSLHDILVIALCTLLCGGEICTDMALFGQAKREFLGSFLKPEKGIPSHDTFSRVFRLLDPEAFHSWFPGFMNRFAQECQGVVAIDGKTLRRSYERAERQSPLHLVSAWAAEQRLVLGQMAVEGKSNEITAVPKLLEVLDLKGTVATADAMRCQRQVAQQVMDQSEDYVLALKANQGTLNGDVRLLLDDPATPVARSAQTNKGHGRVETRTAKVSDGVAWLWGVHQWPGLKAVGQVTATRYQDGQTSTENRYHLLSEAFAPERFNEIVRSHWVIENELHRRLGVVFREDQARNRKGHCAQNLALLRKIALTLARQEPSKGSMRGKLKRAGWDDAFLTTMLLQFANLPMR